MLQLCILCLCPESFHLYTRGWCIILIMLCQIFEYCPNYLLTTFETHVRNCIGIKSFKTSYYQNSDGIKTSVNGDECRRIDRLFDKCKLYSCDVCKFDFKNEIFFGDIVLLCDIWHQFCEIQRHKHNCNNDLNAWDLYVKYIDPIRHIIKRLSNDNKITRYFIELGNAFLFGWELCHMLQIPYSYIISSETCERNHDDRGCHFRFVYCVCSS